MALRDQPYLPLYIQDIMTDERLNECCAATHGVFIKGIMCLMHKSETYGKILLRQKYRHIPDFCRAFAEMLAVHLPYTVDVIFAAIKELTEENVCHFEGYYLVQKRMVRDNEISLMRSSSGKKGAEKTNSKEKKSKDFAAAKVPANSEYENEYVIKDIIGEKSDLWFLRFYHSDYANYKAVYNGKSTTEQYFLEWKSFIDFIYEKHFEELFDCKFLTPHDLAKLITVDNFTKDKWEEPLKKILATGIKPEHNLFFRIPEFINYAKRSSDTKNAVRNKHTAGAETLLAEGKQLFESLGGSKSH